MVRYEQEPITNFRRDLIAEDELRLRCEAILRVLDRARRIRMAWDLRQLRRGA